MEKFEGYISYLRVSTQRQGQSGLGLEAQRKTICDFLGNTKPLAEFVEVESGRKDEDERPQLEAAIIQCQKLNAILVVAKLDRLSRSLAFITRLKKAGIRFVACDMPDLQDPATSGLFLNFMGAIAEFESKQNSQRVKAALAAKKARGEKKRLPENYKELAAKANEAYRKKNHEWTKSVWVIIQELEAYGCTTLKKIAEGLEARGVKTFRGHSKWSESSVMSVRNRMRGT